MHGCGYASVLRNRIAVSFFCECFLPAALVEALLTLCLVRQSVLRGNVFNYKRKRVTVRSRVSRLSMTITMTTAAITTMPSFPYFCRDCESATMRITYRDRAAVLLGINAFCLYQRFTYGTTFCTRIGKVKAGINHPLPSRREFSKRLIMCRYGGR